MNSINPIRCAPLLVLLTVGILQAEVRGSSSETLQSEDLTSPVSNGSKTTYFDLLQKLFPDLQVDSTAHTTIPLRSSSEPHKRQVITGDLTFDFKPYWIKSEGRRLLMLWVNLMAEEANEGTPYEGEAVVLAVFGLEPSVKLLDVMDIKTDRFTDFWEERPILHLNAQSDAFIVYNHHWNSGESYINLEMFFVDAGRFKTIASRLMYNTQACGATFTETLYFRVVADSGNKYPKVLVKVKLRKEPDTERCNGPARGYTRYYQGLYRWNIAKGKYESNSRQLARLDKFNEKRISSP